MYVYYIYWNQHLSPPGVTALLIELQIVFNFLRSGRTRMNAQWLMNDWKTSNTGLLADAGSSPIGP